MPNSVMPKFVSELGGTWAGPADSDGIAGLWTCTLPEGTKILIHVYEDDADDAEVYLSAQVGDFKIENDSVRVRDLPFVLTAMLGGMLSTARALLALLEREHACLDVDIH